MKKKLLFIVGSLTIGGIETYITRLSHSLNEYYEISILNLTSKVDENLLVNMSKDTDIFNFIDITDYKIISKLNFSAINHSLPINYSLLKKKISEIDVIHCVDSETNIIGVEIANYYNARFTSSSYHPKEYVWNNSFYFRKVQRNVIKNIDNRNIFYMNEGVKSVTVKSLNIEDNTNNIIPLGINLDLYINNSPSFSSKKVVSIGRLTHFKTYNELIIKNLDEINRTNNTDLEYHIYGNGVLKTDLMNLAKKQNSKIIFHGNLDYDKLPSVFDDTFIFIGVGTTLIESSAAGVPSVIGLGNYEKELCYGFFHQYDNYLVGEACSDCEEISFLNLFKNICQMEESEYIDLSSLHRKRSKTFDINTVSKRLIHFFNGALKENVLIEHSKIRYFLSHSTWLLLNKMKLRRDREFRYIL